LTRRLLHFLKIKRMKMSRCSQCVKVGWQKRRYQLLGYSNLKSHKRHLSSSRITIKIDVDGIAHVQLNRPDKLNALDLEMFEAIAQQASDLKQDKSIRAVILSGEGRAFCTGLDVEAIGGSLTNNINRLLERPSGYNKNGKNIGNLAQDVGYLWREIPAPVICVMHGMCLGGGLQIALGADFRFSTPDCKISIMESKWGLIPDMAASITLRELIRSDVAKELTMTGRVLNGQEAAQLGLITRCVPEPLVEADRVAREIISKSPDAVAKAKQLYQSTWVSPEKECLEEETSLQQQLLFSWNQIVASGRNFGIPLPYMKRKDPKRKF